MHHSRLQGHPHIIGMREAYLTNDHLCVVMDYADGGDLAEHLSRHVYGTVRRCDSVQAACASARLAAAGSAKGAAKGAKGERRERRCDDKQLACT